MSKGMMRCRDGILDHDAILYAWEKAFADYPNALVWVDFALEMYALEAAL